VVKRRSFEDGLTADEEAFLKQGRAKPTAKIPKPKSPPQPQPKKEEPPMSKPAFKQPIAFEPAPVAATIEPAAPLKVSNLSVRIDSRISAALLRAMTERRIGGLSPSTQQDIVAEAMIAWLKKNGYFSES
jgi:hypothetical protein